jgi:hypothetical protein
MYPVRTEEGLLRGIFFMYINLVSTVQPKWNFTPAKKYCGNREIRSSWHCRVSLFSLLDKISDMYTPSILAFCAGVLMLVPMALFILCNYTSVVTSQELVFPTVADVTAWFSDLFVSTRIDHNFQML